MRFEQGKSQTIDKCTMVLDIAEHDFVVRSKTDVICIFHIALAKRTPQIFPPLKDRTPFRRNKNKENSRLLPQKSAFGDFSAEP
jgi:hypothetical protein